MLRLDGLAAVLSIAALLGARSASAQPKSVPITIRDFNASHADFESTRATCSVDGSGLKGLVQDTLDANHKPIPSATSPCPKYDIRTWFRDDATVNRRYCQELALEQVPGSVNTYKTPLAYEQNFFPIDSVANPNPPGNRIKAPNPVNLAAAGETFEGGRNFHFCMEMHATFKYRGGEVFDFKGDDDVWVFVNNRLALDLGGLQNNGAGQVDLDAQKDALKIAVDNYYNFDFFFCERQTTGSHLQITTSIDIIPPPAPGLHIADADLNVIRSGDTIPLNLGSDAKVLKAVKIETQTQTLDCNNLISQIKNPASGNWSFNNGALPPGAQVSLSPAGLVAGVYKLILEKDGLRDSIWVRIADLPKVAAPSANPPGGDFSGSVQVALASATPGAIIHYTTDGTVPGKTSPIYAGPITLTGDTPLKAMAERSGYTDSDVMTWNFSKTLAKAVKGYYQDRDGDGRIETAVILFDGNYRVPPKDIKFTDPFERSKTSASTGSTPGTRSMTVTLAPFAPGTGFTPDILAHIAADGEFAAQGVTMEDSVGPVVKAVRSIPSSGPGVTAAVEIEFSEPVPLDPASLVLPLEIRRGQGTVDNAQVRVSRIVAISPSKYRVEFQADSKYPIPGDSVRIARDRPVSDALGNKSDMRYFIPVSGDPARAKGDLNVGLADGVTKGTHILSVRPMSNPVVVHGKLTCVNCGDPGIKEAIPSMEPGRISTVGPTWKVMTKYPFRYSMTFFDNLGHFVNKAEGNVGPEGFEKLRATEAVGDSVLVELTFLPYAKDGNAIATGAYIMKGILQIQDQQGLKGSQGETITLVPAERTLISRFGYVRH
jgi:fibro-slime domain-containing protein